MYKSQITNHKSQTINNDQMTKIPKKTYDLEMRTLEFAKSVIKLCQSIPSSVTNIELIKQIIKSSGSVGANYREANEALGKKDFVHRMRITRKETKETTYWLELILEANPFLETTIKLIMQESKELRSIFTSIIDKSMQSL